MRQSSRLVFELNKEVKWRRNEFFGITLKLCCFAMYRIHQHKLVVVQIETHKSYIKMNNNNNQLKNICWRGVFLLPFLGIGCFGFFSIEWNETNWEARQEKTKQTRRMRVWGRYRRITRKWTQDRAEKRGGTTSIKFKPIYIFFGITNVYIYTEKKRKIKTIERNILTRAREREGINSNFEGFPAYFSCWVIGK